MKIIRKFSFWKISEKTYARNFSARQRRNSSIKAKNSSTILEVYARERYSKRKNRTPSIPCTPNIIQPLISTKISQILLRSQKLRRTSRFHSLFGPLRVERHGVATKNLPQRQRGCQEHPPVGLSLTVQRLRKREQILIQNLANKPPASQRIHHQGVLLEVRHRGMLGIQSVHRHP